MAHHTECFNAQVSSSKIYCLILISCVIRVSYRDVSVLLMPVLSQSCNDDRTFVRSSVSFCLFFKHHVIPSLSV